jgi:hypothetical protein
VHSARQNASDMEPQLHAESEQTVLTRTGCSASAEQLARARDGCLGKIFFEVDAS